jgi:hypothetical protein
VHKHFYPRQPRHKLEGAVEGAKLEVRHRDSTRIVEAAIPWSEFPRVAQEMRSGRPVKFSFRVNDNNRSTPGMELAMGRSAAEGGSRAFHPDWSRSWPNELEFAFEPVARPGAGAEGTPAGERPSAVQPGGSDEAGSRTGIIVTALAAAAVAAAAVAYVTRRRMRRGA